MTSNLDKRVLFKYHAQYTFKMQLFHTGMWNVFWNLSLKEKQMTDLHKHTQHHNATTHTTEDWEPSADCSFCNTNNITQIAALTLPHQNVCRFYLCDTWKIRLVFQLLHRLKFGMLFHRLLSMVLNVCHRVCYIFWKSCAVRASGAALFMTCPNVTQV